MIRQLESKSFLFFLRDHLRSTLGITCGRGSFAVHFGDHLRSRDQLRLGIICGTVQHPMNLFLKIFVLQANFYWLGDLEKKCVSLEGMLLGNKGCLRGFDVRIAMCYLPAPPSH